MTTIEVCSQHSPSSSSMLLIGDVIGSDGVAALESGLAELRKKYSANLVVVNGENACDGFGLTEVLAKKLFDCGVDVITSGNHIWENHELWDYLDTEKRILRPANYPCGTGTMCADGKTAYATKVPGNGYIVVEKNNAEFLLINLQGRQSLYNIDCPFRCFDSIYDEHANLITVVDFHAEVSEEKEALSFYTQGRASLVAGTHTHIQTADEKILPGGTAYITDIGMTGCTDSVIGMEKSICIKRNTTNVFYKMQCAQGDVTICGVNVVFDIVTRKALSIERFAYKVLQ
ncbi:MAG: TIGR00282 family metallophosphoesterase [Termitinemataceae bacterium]|nr:MAG: TIGR00282 family metallophosphoesterase [Termitinemataceae bacterium]